MIDVKKIELDNVFQEFVNTKKAQTKYSYTTYLKQWIAFSGLNGKETLALKQNNNDAIAEKKAVQFKAWLQQQGYGETTSQTAIGCLRGFYAFHRIPLVFIDSEKKTLAEANRKTEDYLFSKEDLAKMVAQANLNEKYIVLVGKSIGLRAGDFLNITFGKLRALDLSSETPIFIGETVTQKEHVKAYPFLDSDSIPVVKAILDRSPNANDADMILPYDEQTLTKYIHKLMDKAHIDPHGKVARFHNLRKYLIDRLSAVASESQWKQIVGKKIEESAYVSQDQLRDVYARAMPSIIINGNGKNYVKMEELEQKVKQLTDENNLYKVILKDLVKDKIEQDVKVIPTPLMVDRERPLKLEGEKGITSKPSKHSFKYKTVLVKTIPVASNKWTEMLKQLET